jgi:hypothetical protein
MARYFNAAVNCGPDQAAANRIAQAFRGHAIEVAPGVLTTCEIWCGIGKDHGWHVSIQPEGAWYGMKSTRLELLTPEARTAIARAIHAKLRTCDGFMVADVGWETQDNINLSEILGDFMSEWIVVRADLRYLVSEELNLVPFSDGYLSVARRMDGGEVGAEQADEALVGSSSKKNRD